MNIGFYEDYEVGYDPTMFMNMIMMKVWLWQECDHIYVYDMARWAIMGVKHHMYMYEWATPMHEVWYESMIWLFSPSMHDYEVCLAFEPKYALKRFEMTYASFKACISICIPVGWWPSTEWEMEVGG